ncbi:MAG TPA: alpha/beta hydrolase-fold protein [Verrucomicrobiae bacterium]|nr:alpha/beta hydrolase-fold protein [Verrucomicrobiae bacterium]
MRRALFLACLSALLAAGVSFAQTKKPSNNSKPAVRQDLSPAPVAGPGAPAVPAHPNPYNVYGAQYPRIEADNRVTFHFTAPNAQKVQVALVTSGQGSLNPLPYDMVKGTDGVWTYTSVPQSPGYHNYWMLVDGSIVLDPATKAFMGYSHMCNGFEIPEPGVDWYDLKDVPHGHLEAANYFARSIHAWRHILVYTPPGYDDKANLKTRYPVVYLQHGSGEDETVWFEMGRTNLVLDNLLAAGKAKPMIVVSETSIIANTGGRGAAPAPGGRGGGFGGGRGGGAYGQLMTNELIPWVDSHFRTMADRDHRAMAGLSMGGGITAAVTMVNLDKFSYIGLFSGGSAAGFGGRGRGGAAPGAAPAAAPAPATLDLKTVYSGAMADPAEFNRKVKVLFMSYGAEPPLENPEGLKKHQEQLTAAGITNSYIYLSPGTTHEWQTWRRSFYTFAQLLFK